LAEAAEMIDDKCPHYKYTPANVLENENFKPHWSRSILKAKTINFNRPDITFMNKKTKNTFLLNILTYLLTYLLTYSLHGAQSFLRS